MRLRTYGQHKMAYLIGSKKLSLRFEIVEQSRNTFSKSLRSITNTVGVVNPSRFHKVFLRSVIIFAPSPWILRRCLVRYSGLLKGRLQSLHMKVLFR